MFTTTILSNSLLRKKKFDHNFSNEVILHAQKKCESFCSCPVEGQKQRNYQKTDEFKKVCSTLLPLLNFFNAEYLDLNTCRHPTDEKKKSKDLGENLICLCGTDKRMESKNINYFFVYDNDKHEDDTSRAKLHGGFITNVDVNSDKYKKKLECVIKKHNFLGGIQPAHPKKKELSEEEKDKALEAEGNFLTNTAARVYNGFHITKALVSQLKKKKK